MSLERKTDKQKTCICISCFNYYDTRIKMIKSFFESEGYKVTYITSDYNHFDKSYYTVDYPDTIQVHVPKYSKNISFKRLLSQYLFAKKTSIIVKEKKPDVLYCMFPPNTAVRFMAQYKRENNCKLVFDGYDMWPESFPAGKMSSLLKIPFKLWGDIRDKNIEDADLIFVVSQSMMDAVKDKWKRIPVKQLHPVIVPSQYPNYKFDCRDNVSFCYLGNINHITDIDLLTNILIGVSKGKKVLLHIIGEGQNLSNLLERFEGKNVECIPHGVVMDNDCKREIFAQCHFALNIPREVIHSTMSLKSVEYMSVGLPFINSGEGDTRKIVSDYGIGFNVDNDSISRCVENILMTTPDKLEEMYKKCLKAYEDRFMSLDLGELLKEVLD